MELFSTSPSPAPGRRACHARLKHWTRELLHLGDDATLSVNELRCAEPGCPDEETVIGISVRPGEWCRLRVAKPAHAVTREDLAALA